MHTVSQTPAKQCVLGVHVSATSYDEVALVCQNWIEQARQERVSASRRNAAPRGRYVCVTSVHGVITAVNDPSFRSILNGADIATPDGMPLVWAMRSFGLRGQTRVYGPDLTLKLCEQAVRCGHRVFLYGGREETLQALMDSLLELFPDIRIAGMHATPFRPLTPEEDDACVRMIQEAETDLLLVGLSTPKQDRWMADHVAKFRGIVMIGVGAAFDFHAGRVKQAPRWIQQAGLEWFFRLLMEPRRLWKRYFTIVPLFLPMWAMQKLGILKYPPSEHHA